MATAAVPLLVGTGVQILGAKMGWDPKLTAFASIAAGGITGGMASGAFAGGTAAQSAIAPTATGAVGNPTTVGQGLASSAVPSAVSWNPTTVGQGLSSGGMNYTQNISPAYSAVDAVKAPFFDRTQYTYETRRVELPDGTIGSEQVRMPKVDGQGNPIKGMSQADALGVSMLDTFLQYELALAQQPPPRIPSSGGGGGGGGGGASGPAYQGGGGGKPYKVVDFYGTGGTASYQPQPI